MDSSQLPQNSDCYATWELDTDALDLTWAEVKLNLPDGTTLTEHTGGTKLTILTSPRRVRLRLAVGDVTQTGLATVELTATDTLGDTAKRRIIPNTIKFW